MASVVYLNQVCFNQTVIQLNTVGRFDSSLARKPSLRIWMAEGHRMCKEAVITAKGWPSLNETKKEGEKAKVKTHGSLLMQ